MMREYHVRFRERFGVKLPLPTLLVDPRQLEKPMELTKSQHHCYNKSYGT